MYDHTVTNVQEALGVPPEQYVALGGLRDLPDDVRADSEMWCERFFTREADPHLVTTARSWAHLATDHTPDLIRHEYVVGDLRVDVVESRICTIIRPEPTTARFAALSAEEQKNFARRAAARLVNMMGRNHAWELPLPPQLKEGVLFSTNPAVEPVALGSWEERMDGGVFKGGLFFFLFKKVDQIFGFENDRQWFDDDFRARIGKR